MADPTGFLYSPPKSTVTSGFGKRIGIAVSRAETAIPIPSTFPLRARQFRSSCLPSTNNIGDVCHRRFSFIGSSGGVPRTTRKASATTNRDYNRGGSMPAQAFSSQREGPTEQLSRRKPEWKPHRNTPHHPAKHSPRDATDRTYLLYTTICVVVMCHGVGWCSEAK